jgi:hypothetical protein
MQLPAVQGPSLSPHCRYDLDASKGWHVLALPAWLQLIIVDDSMQIAYDR